MNARKAAARPNRFRHQHVFFVLTLLQHVMPGWVERAGGPDSEAVKLFNEKVSPVVGDKINDDGTAAKVK